MADVSDVWNAVAKIIDATVYPTGDNGVSAIVVDKTPVDARIYPGWPVSAKLDADLKAGLANISVFAPRGTEQNTTRFPMEEQVVTTPVHTVTLAIDATGTQVTLGGSVSTPQNLALIVNGQAFVYPLQSSDTLVAAAAALAALVNAAMTASASGQVISIPGAKQLVARVGGAGSTVKPVGTQRRQFQISIWAPTPKIRDTIATLIEPPLRLATRLALADGTMGLMTYAHGFVSDEPQKENLFRRDLFYVVEYSTVITAQATEIVVVETEVSGGLDPTEPAIATFYD